MHEYADSPSFMSEDEIVADLVKRIRESPEELEAWQRETRVGMQMRHFTLGMWIRNHYKLWDPDNPHTKSFESQADSTSDRVIGRVLDELRNASRPGLRHEQS